jgi:putative heme-binding domain-containing protein
MLRSRTFTAPTQISFYLAGHCGRPNQDDPVRNFVRLRDATTGALLMEIAPPRNDTAQLVNWDLQAIAGRQVVFELVDGDDANGYAWFAVGRFTPAVVEATLSQEAWRLAVALARDARAVAAAPALETLLAATTVDDDIRGVAAEALAAINATQYLPGMITVLQEPSSSAVLRKSMITLIARHKTAAADAALSEALRTGAAELQIAVAVALAGNAHGASLLLDNISTGKAPVRVLVDRQVAERLAAQPSLQDRVTALTKNLPPVSAEREALIRERLAGFSSTALPADAVSKGAAQFAISCAVCHRLGGQGALVGPQLDGVGVRGPARLLEDILDPNRNVDHAFRQSVLTMHDGQFLLGMIRREEGESLILADMTGKENTIAKATIKTRADSTTSLMPDIFSQTMSVEQMNYLLAYLLSQR